PLIVTDLKDWFFTIPLQELDRCRFAFSIPSSNMEEAALIYQWKVFPQGTKNSPIICQNFVQAIAPVRQKWPEAKIIHYMNDICV
ncbi:POK19 protein, partial [Oreotrochilus melanogaster]|nr:POK19 protein [Oreotrochilus melanogaster]